jgi:DNA-binding NarL/FixJ family response regulator
MSKPVRILVVDDHPIVRAGIVRLLQSEAGLSVCGEADAVPDAVRLATTLGPDLAIVDISLKGGTAFDLLRALPDAAGPKLPVIILSVHDEALFAERALRAGARGYLMKTGPLETLLQAVRQVLSGRVYVSDEVAQNLLERLGHDVPPPGGRLGNLTDRELEVFGLIGQGLSTAAIAKRLSVSVKTIETYRSNIKTKLGAKDASDLVRYATAWNLFM